MLDFLSGLLAFLSWLASAASVALDLVVVFGPCMVPFVAAGLMASDEMPPAPWGTPPWPDAPPPRPLREYAALALTALVVAASLATGCGWAAAYIWSLVPLAAACRMGNRRLAGVGHPAALIAAEAAAKAEAAAAAPEAVGETPAETPPAKRLARSAVKRLAGFAFARVKNRFR